MWLFLLAARHRMQALSALACSVGCAFSGFARLKIVLFIQPHDNNVGGPFLLGRPHWYVVVCYVFLQLFLEALPQLVAGEGGGDGYCLL